MKYMGMPWGMWTLFAGSFQAQLTDVLGYNEQTAKAITRRAKAKYKEILSRLPEFEKGDRFKISLVGCAMLGAFVHHAGASQCGSADGVLRQGHDDKAYALVLP